MPKSMERSWCKLCLEREDSACLLRAGLVNPPSLVSSAVDADAILVLLINDRRRNIAVVI